VSKVLYYHLNSFPEISDRTEYKLAAFCALHSPRFRFGFDNYFDLVDNPFPEIPTNYTDTFEELVNRRAVELWDIGKPIRVWWSGGIDSTCALVSLLKTRRLDTNLIVYLSTDSVQENPRFYDLLVNKKVNLQWHSATNHPWRNLEMWNGETINVNGGGGNELFLALPHSIDLETLFKIKDDHWMHIISNSDTLEVVNQHIKISPYKPETIWEFFWWMAKIIDDLSQIHISPRFLEDPSVYNLEYSFFTTDYFDLWSLMNPSAGHNGTWNTYKWPLKKIIYEYDKDEDYFLQKIPEGSVPKIWKKWSHYRPDSITPIINKIVYEDGTFVRLA
jgi:hypothetical protein